MLAGSSHDGSSGPSMRPCSADTAQSGSTSPSLLPPQLQIKGSRALTQAGLRRRDIENTRDRLGASCQDLSSRHAVALQSSIHQFVQLIAGMSRPSILRARSTGNQSTHDPAASSWPSWSSTSIKSPLQRSLSPSDRHPSPSLIFQAPLRHRPAILDPHSPDIYFTKPAFS